ncbi:flavin reductase family protein [Frondihabitans australicus]|uniref:Flavin reductase (DIM6/NTAB) family NADH-FMN oxidoreductase RutF n=1 Tax=Frondihabitans australicus TaxID=386892 RepID=A0A495IMA2_9MICO|nr:flavin reductase family protein [Frondihabitans australicus]RKR76255.1 flavin reductase (DIM6/NTAB) family NADH-FMN oxidoreductase RutF [Frondihabitans australicus]
MALTPYSPDSQLLRTTFSYFPSGVVALAAEVDGEREGMVASSFTVGVSMEPPLVAFSVQNTSTTWPTLKKADRIGISVLGETHGQTARQIAAKDKSTRFENLELETSDSGALFVHGSPVWLETKAYAEYPAGDHQMILLEVTGLYTDASLEPLVFHGSAFKQLLKSA